MKRVLLYVASTTLLFALLGCNSVKPDSPPGGIKLPPGYKHRFEGGIDSSVGRIWKDGGLTIEYDIGGIAGEYLEPEEKNDCIWYKEESINNQSVRYGLTKEKRLVVTFPSVPANFFATVKTEKDIADVLAVVFTYQARTGS